MSILSMASWIRAALPGLRHDDAFASQKGQATFRKEDVVYLFVDEAGEGAAVEVADGEDFPVGFFPLEGSRPRQDEQVGHG